MKKIFLKTLFVFFFLLLAGRMNTLHAYDPCGGCQSVGSSYCPTGHQLDGGDCSWTCVDNNSNCAYGQTCLGGVCRDQCAQGNGNCDIIQTQYSNTITATYDDGSGQANIPFSLQYQYGRSYSSTPGTTPQTFQLQPYDAYGGTINYTVTVNPPSGTTITSTYPGSFTANPDKTINFIVHRSAATTPTTTPTSAASQVTGTISVDTSGNQCNPGTPNSQSGSIQLIPSVGAATTQNSITNSYSFAPVSSGTYQLALTIPGYRVLTTNGTPPTAPNSYGPFSVPPNKSTNWCITNSTPWFQTNMGDVRFGSIAVKIPPRQYISTDPTYPGIIIGSKGTVDAGNGFVSSKGWKIENENSYNTSSTSSLGSSSYSFYESRIKQTAAQVTDISSSICSPSNCNLSVNRDGIYIYREDPTRDNFTTFNLASYTDSGHHHVVVLIKGKVIINNNITLGGAKSLFILAAKGDIDIGQTVGSDINDNTTIGLEGIYTSENNIILDGLGCSAGSPDRRLNVSGTLIANSLNPFSTNGTGKVLYDSRSLCRQDSVYPILTVTSRPDFLTQLTDFYKTVLKRWQEVNP